VSTGKPQGGSQLTRTVIALILFAVAIVALNLGLQDYYNGDLASAILWFSLVAVSIGFVSFTTMRVRRGYSLGALNNKVFAIVLCTSCTFKQIRNFGLGDYVFKQEGKCTQCGNTSLYINGIYSEDLKKR
jgi:hypothetical protein